MSVAENIEHIKSENEALGNILEDQTAMLHSILKALKETSERITILSKETNINSVKLDRFTDVIKNTTVQEKRTVGRAKKATAPRENINNWIKTQCLDMGVVEFFDQFIQSAPEIVDDIIEKNKDKINKKKAGDDRDKYIASTVWKEVKDSDNGKTIIKSVKALHTTWLENKAKKEAAKLENIEK